MGEMFFDLDDDGEDADDVDARNGDRPADWRRLGDHVRIVVAGSGDGPIRAGEAEEAAAGTGTPSAAAPGLPDPDAVDPRIGLTVREREARRNVVRCRLALMEALETAGRPAHDDFLVNAIHATGWTGPDMPSVPEARGRIDHAADLHSVGLPDPLETMLTDQLAAAHTLAMALAGRANGLCRRRPIYEAAAGGGAERAALAAGRMMGAFRTGLLALDRIRNGNQLTITVERVGS